MSRELEERVAAMPEPDLSDPDNPEWTEADFARAVRVDDLPRDQRDALLAAFPKTRLRGPGKAPRKRQVTLRIDPDLIEHFKAGGPGWQSRLNAALREAVETKIAQRP